MLTQEQAVEVRVLQRQGKSIRSISRETGLSRVTVRRYLQDPEAARRYGPREPRATKLESIYERGLKRRDRHGFRQRCCFGRSVSAVTRAA
jgi:transposase